MTRVTFYPNKISAFNTYQLGTVTENKVWIAQYFVKYNETTVKKLITVNEENITKITYSTNEFKTKVIYFFCFLLFKKIF